MGSSRKKGSGSAAAAAAQQQWKVGDLVLAKMRGFPAWPAVISDPEKWGFSAMSKKLFVYFYGTKQIAFCNYADIEAFTEEKKKSLLLKRQGKGADFVRALDEIIDIYDTTKKQKMLQSNSGDDEVEQSAEVLIRVRSSGNSSSLNEGIELETHMPSDHKLEAAQSMVETSGGVDCEEVFTASTADDLHKNLVIDEPIESILDQLRQDPLATSTSLRKKRLRDDPQNGIVLQKRLPSLRMSRSLIADSSKFQESTEVYNSDPSGTLVPEVIKTENAESKSNQRLSHTFLSHDVNASCTASSNGGSEDAGAQVSAKDYDEAIELNRSIIEPRCHLVDSRNVYFDSDDKLNGNHKSCMNDVVIKKKKETNREHKDITNKSSLVSEEDDLQVVLNRTPPSFPKEARLIIYEGDGDEHLPLVKRARVRMCKPNSETTAPPTHCEPVREVDKSETSSIMNNCDRHHASFSVEESSPFSGSLLKINEDLNSSLVNDCSSPSGKDPIFWKAEKYQLNDSVLDAEAALPLSKRLHRALEAMSANESESRDDRPESQRDTDANASIGLPEMSVPRDCSSDAKFGSPVRLQRIHSSNCNSHASSQPRSPLKNLGNFSFVSPEVKPSNFHTEIVSGPNIRDCNKIVMNVAKCNEFSVPISMIISKKENSQSFSSKFIEEEVTVSPSKGKPDKACSFLEKENNDMTGRREGRHYICSENVTDETVEPTIQKEDALTNTEESSDCFPADGTLTTVSASDMISIASSASRATVSSSVQSDEDSKIVNMRGASQVTPSCRCISPDLTPMKQLIAAAQAKRLMSRSTSFPFSSLDGKANPDAIVSPSLLHKGDSSGHGSPQSDFVNHTTIDDRVHVLQNGVRSPHVGLRLKSVNRSCNAEANAAWRTFEALVYTLSRTKESIGRATRLAIDCAKYGMAGEVVEFLLHYLEREQSLHKKIDLLFLVDSITQCSRNQKGGDGGVYPSHVQSLLPRLLSAAAPRGNAASENRRQCLKVLRLWLERNTLPEPIIRHHMRELDSANELYLSTGFSRRPMKTERAINDPLREMEGMLVDEYGSNTNFQLPQLLHANVLEDEEGNASDGKNFEAVTPETCAQMDREKGTFHTQKNRHVLEDVDVELEMEDVSPPCEVKMNLSPDAGANAAHLHDEVEQLHSLPFAPLPEDRPPSPPPLPSSPPPFVIPSSNACAVVPQWRSGAHTLADTADLGPSNNCPSVQNKQSHSCRRQPSNQNVSLIPSKPATYYGPNFECIPSQIPPRPPVSYSTVSASNPSMHSQSNLQPLVSTSLSDTAYHVLPPPPTVSNQFSYVQSETQQRAPSWRNCSFADRFQYAHESHRGNFHCDQATRRLVQHEQFQHQYEMRASSMVQPGPPHYDKIEASPATQPHHGRPLGLPPVPCNGWSLPHRMSNYSTPASRPSVEGSTPNMAGTCGYWRPR